MSYSKMNYKDKSKEELIIELLELQEKHNSIMELYEKEIHESKLTEKALKKSQSLLNETGKLSKVGGWEFDVKTFKQTWTEEIFHILEIDTSAGEPKVQEGLQFFAPSSKKVAEQAVKRAIEYGEPYDLEIEIITTKGNYRWVHSIGKANYEDGKIVSISGVFQDITDQKQAELIKQRNIEIEIENEEIKKLNEELFVAQEKLKKNEQSYGLLVNSIPSTSIYLFNKELRFLIAGGGEIEKSGFDKSLIEGKILRDAFPKDVVDLFEPLYQKALTGVSTAFEMNYGDYTYFQQVLPVFDETGEIYAGTVISQNITERIQFEIKLKESQEKFKQLVWDMQVGVLLQGPHAEILMSNPKALELLGISEDQLLGKTSFDPDWNVIHENGSPFPGPTHPVPQAIASRQRVQNVVMGVYRPIIGDRVWLIVDAKPQLYDDGTVKQVVCTFINITERKHAQEVLRKSEERYALTLDAVNDGFWDWDVPTGNAFFSPHYYSILGYENNEFPATYSSWRELVHHDDLGRIEQELQQSINSGKGFSIDLRMKLKDGNWRWVSTRGRVVEWGIEQKALRMVGTLTDISERKQTEMELVAAKKRAEESDLLKTAFLQNMSHEIRTPMNAIMGFSEILADNYNNKTKLEQFSKIIYQRSADLLELINEILDIAKIESGQLSVHLDDCDLNSLFAELSQFFEENQKRLNKQHINLAIQTLCDPLGKVIITDKVKLKQIFINLIGNAFKFTEKGKIEAGCKLNDKNELLFYVSDTGIGIPADKQNFVFERFSQLSQGEKSVVGGTGLGLSIVKGLVNLLGGEIWVESTPGKGTTFYFTIYFRMATVMPQAQIVVEPNAGHHFNHKTILIVEDDMYNAEYIKEILSEEGLTILHTKYGREAIDMALVDAVDLILMDINLPDINGYEATRLIKQIKPELKIIAQTAYAAPEDRHKALNAGCNDYISKPLKRNLLLAMIGKQIVNND